MVPALSSLVKLFSEPGDSILIQTPVYSEFYDVTEAWGRNVLENQLVEKDGAWSIDFEDFEEKAKQARMFLLCSPHNPLGIVWTREELDRMARICMENDVLLVSDEIHSDLVFHGKKHIPTATLSDEIAGKVITCISGTKTFNLAGLQASATIFPNEEMKKKFDTFWMAMDIHRNNAFSSVAMEAASMKGRSGWNSCCHIWKPTLISSVSTVKPIFPRLSPLSRMRRIWCGWTAVPLAWTMKSSADS